MERQVHLYESRYYRPEFDHANELLMKSRNWRDIAELVGIAAIVASLVFVGIQLRQEQIIARSELTSQSFHLQFALQQSLMNADLAKAYAKMLGGDEELSLDEKIQIDNLLAAARTMYIRECYLEARGVLIECKAIVQETVRRYFGNAYGRSWWFANKPTFDEGLAIIDWVDKEIESLDRDAYRQHLENATASE